jgi:hypothetical protein
MRHATAIETDLLQIQAETLSNRRHGYETGDDTAGKPQSIVAESKRPMPGLLIRFWM